MRKGTLICVLVFFLILLLGIFWYGTGPDVHIADMSAAPIGVQESGQLDIVLRNNGTGPVDVWLEVENTFVDSDGVAHHNSGLLIPSDSGDPWDTEFVSHEKPIHLLPGNNSVGVWIGYYLPGEYPVKVKVVENSRTLDEDTYLVEILPPEIPRDLYLKLEYEMERRNTSDIYRIYGYLINKGLGSEKNVSTNFTVINEKTGDLVFTSSEIYGVGEYDKTPLWTWSDYPYAVVEIAYGEPSGESYMPVQNAVVGKSGDRFRINVTSTWQNRSVSAELLVPPGGKGGDAYDKAV
ncbi:hypothetical protein [Methanosarcina mazei]|uniref:Uncharacterized protein n=4 Tax=Methanosarcina mazei TaxID=2209 RepID=A0A0F8MPE1_METMZ|nr:hypothetical protein [Methanosarcina mazei]AKB39789.1 hypothetical protein MSMAW_0798 [Methanosarcina mazei WWM610]AKB70685.1 hypothetical protein MSMAC_0795 [Methanosarcina mazei C16]KKG02238.1 hypothetical protein DU47_05615 [Methanosarcina mazei]KKG03775.1 hypothetical protein DU40_06490 [Methanosarcina mazei]KKG08878.1 hypothetical protein DU31_06880 [Methanosarcina mazei]